MAGDSQKMSENHCCEWKQLISTFGEGWCIIVTHHCTSGFFFFGGVSRWVRYFDADSVCMPTGVSGCMLGGGRGVVNRGKNDRLTRTGSRERKTRRRDINHITTTTTPAVFLHVKERISTTTMSTYVQWYHEAGGLYNTRGFFFFLEKELTQISDLETTLTKEEESWI